MDSRSMSSSGVVSIETSSSDSEYKRHVLAARSEATASTVKSGPARPQLPEIDIDLLIASEPASAGEYPEITKIASSSTSRAPNLFLPPPKLSTSSKRKSAPESIGQRRKR